MSPDIPKNFSPLLEVEIFHNPSECKKVSDNHFKG